jgi:hypothetical protein
MKKVVLKYAALVLWALSPTISYAQVNPKQGFIINNQNDTIYGTIDYLSDRKCANECRFLPNGESSYKTYLPGEIKGYRFADNGVFYVTKTFAVDSGEKTFFAEYLLEGGVSLFRYSEGDNDYFFFIGEDGKVATVKNDGSYSKAASDEYTRNKQATLKRKALGEVSQVFSESNKALHDLWIKDINAKNLTQITHDYDMEYCTSAGDCVVFRYNEKATRNISVRLLLKAGLVFGKHELEGFEFPTFTYNGLTMKSTVPEIGVGADFTFPRFNKHLSFQLLALINKWDMTEEYWYHPEFKMKVNTSLKYWDLGLQLGPTYSFMPESKVSPILSGGYAIDLPLSVKETNMDCLSFGQLATPTVYCHGFYVGAGVDFAIRKHVLRLMAEYRRTSSSNDGLDLSRLGICAEFRL